MNIAVFIGVSEYQHLNKLPACKNDVTFFRELFCKIKHFEDVLFIDSSPRGIDAKRELSDFINKYKGKDIEEFIFYFSGHGARYENDFFFPFSDFREEKKESTSLRNTELDNLIRNLNPKLTVKFIDACFCGGQYIKSESDINFLFEKSASHNKFQNLYFFFSSRENETSEATSEISYFSKHLLRSFLQMEGNIRYRDLMAFVADEFSSTGKNKPIFLVQANNTELVGTLSKEDHKKIKAWLRIPEVVPLDEPKIPSEATEVSLLRIIQEASDNVFCTQEEGINNLNSFISIFKVENFREDFQKLFQANFEIFNETRMLPNPRPIGEWLLERNDDEFFAQPDYETRKYEVEEYKEVPRKPIHSDLMRAALGLEGIFGGKGPEYRLEKVVKTKSIICGFKYSQGSEGRIIKVAFQPKLAALRPFSLYTTTILSRKSLAVFYSYEELVYLNWSTTTNPKCANWKSQVISLKNLDEVNRFGKLILLETETWILERLQKEFDKVEKTPQI